MGSSIDLSFQPGRKAGMSIGGLESGLSFGGKWDVEKRRSSSIHLIPEKGIIVKDKKRKPVKAFYEAYSTIFMAALLRQYNGVLPDADLTFYCPEVLRVEWEQPGETTPLFTRTYQFFVPGRPFNHVNNRRSKDFTVDNQKVRIGNRMAYLAGALTQIWAGEGIVHNDLQTRHLFILPTDGKVQELDRDGNLSSSNSRNGIGVIDCENTFVTGPFSSETKAQADYIESEILSQVQDRQAEGYFEKGKETIRQRVGKFSVVDSITTYANNAFGSRFSEANVERVDMRELRVYLK